MLLALCAAYSSASVADDDLPAADAAAGRPVIKFNRWQEDWSVLANPDVPREPFDDLKYIRLSDDDPKAYSCFLIYLSTSAFRNRQPAAIVRAGERQSLPYFLPIPASNFVHCLPTDTHFSCV
jgi:hypothetical protein